MSNGSTFGRGSGSGCGSKKTGWTTASGVPQVPKAPVRAFTPRIQLILPFWLPARSCIRSSARGSYTSSFTGPNTLAFKEKHVISTGHCPHFSVGKGMASILASGGICTWNIPSSSRSTLSGLAVAMGHLRLHREPQPSRIPLFFVCPPSGDLEGVHKSRQLDQVAEFTRHGRACQDRRGVSSREEIVNPFPVSFIPQLQLHPKAFSL